MQPADQSQRAAESYRFNALLSQVFGTLASFGFPETNLKGPRGPASVYEYIGSDKFARFWHGLLGNMVSNWYFYVAGRELVRIHKYSNDCRLNPSWAKDVRPIADGFDPAKVNPPLFDYKIVPAEDQEREQKRIDAELSGARQDRTIAVVLRLLQHDKLWRSESEKQTGWVFIALGEVLLYSFEHALLSNLQLQFGPQALISSLGDSVRRNCATEAWQQVVRSHWHCGDSEEHIRASSQAVNDWLRRVVVDERTAHSDWWAKSPRDWFIHRADELEAMLSSPKQITEREWTSLILSTGEKVSVEQCRTDLDHRLRFSPVAEEKASLQSRNLVLVPLWAFSMTSPDANPTTRTSEKSMLRSPFGAIFLATFYSDDVIAASGHMLPILLRVLAQYDIMNFGAAERINREKQHLLSRQLAHALRNRAEILDHHFKAFRSSIQPSCSDAQREQLSGIARHIAHFLNTGWFGALIADDVTLHDFTPIDLGALLSEVLAFVDDRRVRLESPPTPTVIFGDRPMLYDVFLELLSNALDFIDKSTTAKPGKIEVTIERSATAATVHIKDNGPGVDPQIRTRLFTPYACGAGRIGLGLAYCRATIQKHNGRIDEVGTPGIGAHFILELPYMPRSERAK